MGLLTCLFGQKGVVRFEAFTYDGQKLVGKTPIETFGADKKEIEEELKNVIYVEKGIRVSSVNIIGFYET